MSASILDGSGRFRLMSEPAAFPFKDGINGTPEGPVFDLVDCDGFDGVFYLKAEHVIEMAHVLGMSTKEETLEMRARISELELANNSLPANVERLLNGIDNLVTQFHGGIVSDPIARELLSLPGDSQVPDKDNSDGAGQTPDDSGKSESSPSGNAETPDKSAVKSNHPSVGKGPNKLSAGPTDGFGFSS